MLETNIPNINVKNIENQIFSKMINIKSNKSLESSHNFQIWESIEKQINYLKGFIETAKSRSEIRKNLPNSFDKFPLILLKPFGIIFLKILQLIFKDQREVNYNIIQALDESVRLNTILIEQVKSIDHNFQEELSGFKCINQNLMEKNQQLINEIKTLEKSQHFKNINLENKQEDLFYKNLYFQADLTQQKQLINLFLNQISPSNNREKQIITNNINILDGFYLALENNFRGKREEIKIQQKEDYFGLLNKLNIETLETEILDIGCGRGEWLEVLTENGYKAKGIDLNAIMVEESGGRGLDVMQGDCLDYLQSLPDNSLSLITGFHIIEHLPFDILWQLLAECLRVLKSGGLIIFETPNPDNILVASRNFYIDPTHRHPLPSVMVKFLVESIGFLNVDILNLHPISEQQISGDELANRFNEYFYCAQDYAVIGYKP